MKKKAYNKNPSSLAEQLQKSKDKKGIVTDGDKKEAYNKNTLSFVQQLQKLKDRKLVVADDAKAIHYLSQISYYRLSAYFIPYQKVKDTFDTGTTFKQIIDTYSFDRELRLLVFDSIERIEIAVRTQIIYCMATQYNDSHWQDDKSLFIKPFTIKAMAFSVSIPRWLQ